MIQCQTLVIKKTISNKAINPFRDPYMTSIIVAPKEDIHAFAVSRECEKLGREVVILDPSGYGSEFNLTTVLSESSNEFAIDWIDGKTLKRENISGIWWRRPFEKTSDQDPHPSVNKIILRERHQALFGSLISGVRNQFNSLEASKTASLKVLQLTVAQQLGLKIPNTLISTDITEVEQWFSTFEGNAVFKMFHGVDFAVLETRKLLREHLVEAWRVTKCPVIFQQYIPGYFDVRATVVGNEVFFARLNYQEHDGIIDSRLTQQEALHAEAPVELQAKLIELVRRLGLRYGAIDLRRSITDEWIFFEINPEGQYLWTEIEAGLQISASIAKQLYAD